MSDINSLMIAVIEISHNLKNFKGNLEQRIKKAMELARHHWLVIDEDGRFKSAIGAIIESLPEGEEREKVYHEMQEIQKFSMALAAAQTGVPVDFGAMGNEEKEERIGLLKMWKETQA